MLVVGLTGGIGSGKTAVSDRFAHYGVPVIDTDLIARELVEPGQPALAEIAAEFGPECLDNEGRLNRAHLRQRVFADEADRRRLEAILHPRIRAVARERIAALTTPYCLLVIPLLAETFWLPRPAAANGWRWRMRLWKTPGTLQVWNSKSPNCIGTICK